MESDQVGATPCDGAAARWTSIDGDWVIVYLANLVIPGLFGLLVTQEAGRIGMMLGVALLFALGHGLVVACPRIGRDLIVGGVFTGASQFLPFLQMMAGSFALRCVAMRSPLGGNYEPLPPNISTEACGLLATLLTGALLMGLAVAIGLMWRGGSYVAAQILGISNQASPQ